MILEMLRVQIWGMKENLERMIPLLHNFGKMQIDDIRNVPDALLQPYSLSEKMKQDQEKVDLLIANINGLVDLFSGMTKIKNGDLSDETVDETISEIDYRVSNLISQVQYLNNRKKTLQDELISLSKYTDMLQAIAPVMPESSKKSGNAIIRALVHSSQMRNMRLLAQQLKLLTRGKFEMISVKVGESSHAVIGIFPLELMSQVETFMENEKVAQLILPEEYAYLSTDEALRHIEKKVELDHEELDQIDEHMQRMAEKWLKQLKIYQLACQDRVDEFEAYTKIGETDYTFTIIGWVPSEDLDTLRRILKANFGKNAAISVINVPPEMKEKIPVAMRNPEPLSPFEDFVKMRAIPKYSDIDPSTLVAIFMPLFFGMMVGDVGYGLLMLLVSILGLKKVEKGLIADFLKSLRIGAIWSIVFGILYGEYFGTLGEMVGIAPLWISRSEASNVTTLLIMALAVGFGHIMLGLLLGIWNSIIHKTRSETFERTGMLIGLIGLLVLAASLTRTIPHGFNIFGFAILAVGLTILAISLGTTGFFLGPIEFVGIIGNILSYLRIAALGLASVFLAKVANEMAGMVGSVVAGIVIAIVIHALNLVMGMLSPTIQSLRLQYVEFFRRFYQGGQAPFRPFKKRIVSSFEISQVKE